MAVTSPVTGLGDLLWLVQDPQFSILLKSKVSCINSYIILGPSWLYKLIQSVFLFLLRAQIISILLILSMFPFILLIPIFYCNCIIPSLGPIGLSLPPSPNSAYFHLGVAGLSHHPTPLAISAINTTGKALSLLVSA